MSKSADYSIAAWKVPRMRPCLWCELGYQCSTCRDAGGKRFILARIDSIQPCAQYSNGSTVFIERPFMAFSINAQREATCNLITSDRQFARKTTRVFAAIRGWIAAADYCKLRQRQHF